jgi:hypothetical protein
MKFFFSFIFFMPESFVEGTKRENKQLSKTYKNKKPTDQEMKNKKRSKTSQNRKQSTNP